MSSNVNITVYNSKAAQEAAERAELAATKAENIKILNLKCEIPAPSGLVLPTLDPIGNPVVDGMFMEVNKGNYTNVDSTPLSVLKDKGRLYFNQDKWEVALEWDLPLPDVSDKLNRSEIKSNSLIEVGSPYIKFNTAIASNGKEVTNNTSLVGAISIVRFPLPDPEIGAAYTFGKFPVSGNKYYSIVNSSGDVLEGSVGTLASLPKTVVITDLAYKYINICLKLQNSLEPTSDWAETLMLNKGTTLIAKSVNKIGPSDIEAKALSNNNMVPDPTTSKNAINKSYFESNAVLKNGLGLKRSLNRADPSAIISGKYINSEGGISSGNGWKMIAIDITDIAVGTSITFGRFTIDSGGYSAFYNGETLVLNNGKFTNGLLPRTVVKPEGATILYIDISRPTGTNNYSQVTVNVGSTLMDYYPYATIESIDGKPLSGNSGSGPGENLFNQNLNKEDSVQFAKIQAGQIDTSVLVLNLPTSPSGLISGRAWIDIANGNVIKVVS